ncbi:MAG: DUF1295 domain-containing protein, partial [Candidatus Cloacimonetes bacterium]|nr:DUF1295 domain-containing protein [Candidatus Cloacimonadota bacterium]
MINYTALLIVIATVFIYMNIMFALAISKKKNDIVDIAWGMGFVLITILYLILVPEIQPRRIIVNGFVLIWGLRLSYYIFTRNKGKAEDFRYAQWKKDWGKHWMIRSYFQVFIIQGFFMLTIAYPLFFYKNTPETTLNLFDLLGVLVWAKGFFFEAVGDYQLRRFESNPTNKGQIMDKGLWRYTRHPKYFGESL